MEERCVSVGERHLAADSEERRQNAEEKKLALEERKALVPLLGALARKLEYAWCSNRREAPKISRARGCAPGRRVTF